jgi:hypothetical protein
VPGHLTACLQIASRSSKSLEISRNLAVLQSDDPSLFAPPNVRHVVLADM